MEEVALLLGMYKTNFYLWCDTCWPLDLPLSLRRCGSIQVEYDTLFDSANPPTTDQLAQTLQTALDNQGFIPGTNFELDTNSVAFEGNYWNNRSPNV